ncbi:dynein axonemal heavy chain 2-like [Topomyia yanbarensis]|uniref:dynein axonemal heavy chain 2-like n=1 Tax=Topomyia yanbarensis TaxID=2498891 RepID=UPI00273C5AA5|nr:dynein axonemal heavy chain 2-like [Topomyia yanbarensis]
MADHANQDTVADNVSDISNFSDSDSEAKKVVEVVEEAVEESDKPAYTEEDLTTLVEFIRNMIFLFDYDKDDFGDDVAAVIKQWLIDVKNPMMFIFYDGDILSASLAFPLCPFNDLMYFMREPDQLFNVIDRFHDDIIFGTLHSDIEGSLLVILEQVYGPLVLANTEWSEDVKAQILSGYNSFMTYLTELHYKLSGFTLLYVPREGHDMQAQEVAINRSMIKRLEAVAIDWTSQIRSTLSDTQHFVPDDLIRPSDEYNFWLYRHEVLCAIKSQFEGENIQHILKILELAQSLYTKPLREVLRDLIKEIEIAESNIPFLKLMVDPCFAIRTLDSEDDLCSQLIYVMHIIRFIGSDSRHLNKDECITKLFLYLSNEIVSCCMQCIDVDKILTGSPNYGIEICNMKINCCESYKIIYEEMLEQFKHEFIWNLDYAAIFNKINAFIQRLCDILEICEAMLVFGKQSDSSSYKNYRFPCNNAEEYEKKCDQVELIFTAGIEIVQSTSGSILDINDKGWYKYIADFRGMLRTLDDIIENLLSNVFLVAENLEEKIDVLITLLNFYNRESIKESFMRKIAEIWSIFHTELTALSKEVSSGITSYSSLLPQNVGQYTMLKIKFERIYRLKELLERCRFFPQYLESEETLSLFESCEKQVKSALKGFNDVWIKSISTDFGTWLNRNLVCRSQMRPGLLECHIERRMLLTIDEAHFFKVLGAVIPSVVDIEKNDSVKQTFDNVIRIVLYFNNVVSSVSEKERLFFKHMIQQTERKLEPLKSKLTWDEDLGEFIDTFVTNVKELLDVIQVYKQENIKIAHWMESIYSLFLFQLNKMPAQGLRDLQNNISEQKKKSILELVRLLSEISKNIFCIFERLGSNVRRMEESWGQYVQKIDCLLKASIFNSSLETLRHIQKALVDTPFPILSVEIVLDRKGITYLPTLESIEAAIKRLPMEVTSILKLIPSMCQKFQIDSEENFQADFLRNAAYLELENGICQAIHSTIQDLCKFKEKWSVFRPFWSVNRSEFIGKFKLSTMTSEAFHKNIEKFEELLNQLSTQNDITVCKCIEINASKLKFYITHHINDWQIKYIEYLKCISYGHIINFNNTLNKNMEALSDEPKEVEDLKQLEATFKKCYDAIPHMVEEIQIIVEYFNVLEKYVSDVLPEASNLRQNIHHIWQRYMDYINYIKEQIENYQNQFKLSMTDEIATLKVNALEMLKMLDIEMPTTDDILPEDAFLMIDKLMGQLEELEAQENIIKEKMLLLGLEYHPLDVSWCKTLLFNNEQKSSLLNEIFKMTARSENPNLDHFNDTFRLCQNDWSIMIQLIASAILRDEICPKGLAFLQEVEMHRKRFEDLFQSLNEIMQSKRKSCVRLYLISDHLLIKLIAHPFNVEFVNQAIQQMFENISSVCMRRHDLPLRYYHWEVSGVYTKDNESIKFLKPLVLDNLASIEQIINEIEQCIREFLKNALRGCLLQLKRNYFNRVECGWLNTWIHQVCLKSTSIENTLHIRNALVQANLLGKIKPLKMLRTMHNKLLNELTTASKNLSNTDESAWLRKKIDDMVIMEINARDVINHLVLQKVTGLKNFEWLSQVRTYWNDQTGACSTAHLNSIMHYGYECKPSSQPIFMNPHTDRIIMAITSAMKCKFVPYLIGEDENNNVNLLRGLSTELAVLFATLFCNNSWKTEPILRYITGIVELRAWICFSCIEKLPSQILTTINEPSPYQESKVKEILIKLSQNRPIIVTGESVSGKSCLLKAALLMLRNNDQQLQRYHINPETLKLPIDIETLNRSQLDEILTSILSSRKHTRKCIVFDCAELNDCWVKSIDCVQDQFIRNDLTHVPCEGIDLKIVIEIVDLGNAAPTTVSNFEIVHIDGKQLSWKHSFTTWLCHAPSLPDDVKTELEELGNTYLELFFGLTRTSSSFLPKTAELNVLQTFCHLYQSIFQNWKTNKLLVEETNTKEALKKLFFFCCIWSIGASLNENDREKLDVLMREQISDSASSFPLKGNVFQYVVEVSENSSGWVLWNTQHLGHGCSEVSFGDYINTIENIPYQYITALMMKGSKPLLMTSELTVGKSALIKHLVTFRQTESQSNCFTNLSRMTTSICLQRIISRHSTNVAKGIVYPKDRKEMTWILDDLHTVLDNKIDSMEFLRTLIEHKFWYNDQCPQHLKKTYLVAAMKSMLPVRQFSSSSRRLLNKFNLIYHASYNEETVAFIFTQKIKIMMLSDNSNRLLDLLAPATVDLVRCLAARMPPTPSNPRYQFSMKTVGRILNSFCMLSTNANLTDKTSLLRFWIHECYRETHDLLRKADYKKFYEIFNDTISNNFEATLHGLCPGNRSPVFCNMKMPDPNYEDVKEIDQLIHLTETAIQNVMPDTALIVYQEAVEHAAKLLRILCIENGHLILLGEAGSGRSTVCQIVTSLFNYQKADLLENMSLHHLHIKSTDTEEIVDRKFEKLFERCRTSHVLCLVQADQKKTTNQLMLEIVNSIILNGTIDGVYPCSNVLQGIGGKPIWPKIKSKLHFVLCAPENREEYRFLNNAYPSLCTNITSICIHPLNNESLAEIAKKFLQKNVVFDVPILGEEFIKSKTQRRRDSLVQSTEERMLLATTDAMPRIHSATKQDLASLPAPTIVLCSWYFELLFTFKRVLYFKRSKLSNEYKKFHTGISQIIEATHNVTLLQEQLEKQQEQIEAYQLELEEFIENIKLQTIEADEQSQEVAIQREKIGCEEIICKQLAAVAEADLEKAMPALNSAVEALNSLNKKDMNEIKSYARPPVKVELVLNAVMILLAKEPTWAEAKRQLGDQKFLDTLRNFDRNHITDKTLKIIGGFVRNPDLEPNKVGIVSKAAKSLMMWVRAIENYGKVYKYVGPKIKKMEDAQASLLEKQNALKRAEQKLAELAAQLAALHLEYETKMKCKEELEEAARQMALKLARSKALVEGLASEKIRWTNSAKSLEHEYSCLVGDTLLSAGSLVYFGSLPLTLRETLRTQWKIDLEALEILFKENFVLFNHLYHSDVLEVWQSCGLAVDDLSVENATILLNTMRFPLAIDPQNEIHRWIMNLYNAKGILQRNFDEDIPEALIATTVHDRIPLLIYNFQNQSMNNLNELQKVYSLVQQHARDDNIQTKNKDHRTNEVEPEPLLFLTSNDSIALDACSSKIINTVNFVFGLDGLETKLLAFVVEYENPSLEERKELLMRTISDSKKTLISLEENILRILNESDVPLLENEELYDTLQVSKQTATELKDGLEHAEQARHDIDSSREIYKPCAKRAALLFFVLDAMKRFNSFYWFSLDWYFLIFSQSLEKSSRSQLIEERKTRINEYHTYHVYKNVCLGLTQVDQKIFGFYLTICLLYANDEFNTREFNFLLYGAGKIDRMEQTENPSPEWISHVQWDNITELDKLPGFRGITQSLEEVNEDWKTWYMSPYSELEKLPVNWERNLTKFQKYLLVRSLRLDRLESCLNDFVGWNLGRKYSDSFHSTVNDIFSQSSAQTPILLISSTHGNPWYDIQKLASIHFEDPEENLKYLSANTESIETIVNHLKICVKQAKWLYVHDCHKSKPFLSQLSHVVAFLRSIDASSKFRLWMVVDVNASNVPVHVLQECIKFMYDESVGIRQRMHSLYELIGESRFKKIAKTKHHIQQKKILFSLAFFHSLLIERKKFQTLGWMKQHFLSFLDFQLSEKLLDFGLQELMPSNLSKRINEENIDDEHVEFVETIPWPFIKNVCLEVGFGTQITNKWDRRIYDVYTEEIFRPQIETTSQCALVTNDESYLYPRDGNYQSYTTFITKQLPLNDGTNVFGQNENAAIKYLQSRSTYMLQMLRRVNLGSTEADDRHSIVGTAIDYEKAKQTVLELLATLPVYLDHDNAARIVGTNRTPVSECLLLEIFSYNQIVELARKNLEQITRVLCGEHCMTDIYQNLVAQIQKNQLPTAWVAYSTDKCLSDWILDLKDRVEYFRKWSETGQLTTDIFLGRFIRPRLFLDSVLKLHAKASNIPLVELTWDVSVFTTLKPLVRLQITEGFVARGLHLENASWNLEKQCLRQPKILEMQCPMPPIAFKPARQNNVTHNQRTYQCPCFYNNRRQEQDFVMAIQLNCGDFGNETWEKYYTALLLTN